MYQFAFALCSINVSMAACKQWDGVVVCIPSPHLSHASISPITRKTRPQITVFWVRLLTWDPRTTVTLAMAN